MELKTDIPGLYRDSSGGLINKDNSALIHYKNKKDQFRRMSAIEKKIDLIFEELEKIKIVLKKLTNEDEINANSTDNNK